MSSKPSSAFMGVVTVVLTLVGWASVPLFLRHFADSIDFWTSNGWRYGFSALVWLPVLVGFGVARGLPRGLWIAALVPSVVNAAGQVCFTAAHYYIEPGLLTFGLRTQLVFVALGAWMLFPAERAVIRKPAYLIGAALLIVGMTGVILLDTSKDEHISAGLRAGPHAKTIGVTLALCSGLLFAAYGLSVRKYMHGVNSVLAFATICQYTAAAMVVLMLLFGRNVGADPLGFSGVEMVKFLGSALIGIAIGHVFYYFSIARLGVAVTAGVLQLQPFLVAIGSYVFFREVLAAPQWLGGIVAVGGAMLMLSVQWRAGKAKPAIEKPLEIAEGESGS